MRREFELFAAARVVIDQRNMAQVFTARAQEGAEYATSIRS